MGYCGIDCKKCQNYIKEDNRKINRYRKNNINLQDWVGYSHDFKIMCYGCEFDEIWNNEEIFDFCYKCKIRACAIEKGVVSCKECSDFICDKFAEKISQDYNKTLEWSERKEN